MAKKTDVTYILNGRVTNRQGEPLEGLFVRAFDQDPKTPDNPLGQEAVTDAAGGYTIRFTDTDFKVGGVESGGPDVFIRVYEAGKLLGESPVKRNSKKRISIDLQVDIAGPTTSQVVGKVASRVSAGVGDLRVLIVDKGVGGDVPLAEARTTDVGAYQTTFSYSRARHGKVQPDLQARVFAGDVLVGASDVHYNASQFETVNVLLEDKAASALRSEHEVLTSALASHFRGKLGDLKENDQQQNITYLANKTGWDARAVALAALADQFSARTADATGALAIPQTFFYALFRAGLPANEDTLFHTGAKTLEAVWMKAAEQGVIPTASSDQISTLIGRFQALSAQKLLTAPALIGASSLKEILTISRLNDAQQKQFAELYATHRTDLVKFWDAVENSLGAEVKKRLDVNGKLGVLTINNAPLMHKVHATVGADGLSDLLQLAQTGYHRAKPWGQLLTADVPIPKEISGDTPETKRTNYASYLAAQVRVSYPTAAVAEMVKSGELPLTDAAKGISDQVHAFLTKHQGKFEIGVQPVQQYIKDKKLTDADIAPETVKQVKRLQRIYQITPSDQAMRGLLKRGIDAAYHVVRYSKDTFIHSFAEDLGGEAHAALTYDRSVQIHNAILNIALSYLNARTVPAIGVHSPPDILDPVPANTGDVLAYATLESLFGSMDFCACDHCRSILSPAAYLVDLLQFIGPDPDAWTAITVKWKIDHVGAPYPYADTTAWTNAGSRTDTETSPLEVLLSRRPDIQHLPLTCENTNTALPYIDVVNETLEYYVANYAASVARNAALNPPKPPTPLDGYIGHDTNDTASEDLLANPQFVIDSAYETLASEHFPAPLPFHQPLESLRRYFDKFEVPLPLAMERLRKNNGLERRANPYGWRDILMEEIGLSRAEHEILTTSNVAPNVLWQAYGYPAGTSDIDVINGNQATNTVSLSNAKQFTRRIGITYEDIVAILKTRFVNPNSDLIPKLERLGISFAGLKTFKEAPGNTGDAAFEALLQKVTPPPDPEEYGGDIKAWVRNNDNYARIMGLITLTDPTADPNPCSFNTLEFRYSKPMTNAADASTRLGKVEFVRLLRFIRLWRKAGWTIEQTDAAICALYRADLAPLDANNINDVPYLNTGFLTLLPRLGIVSRVMKALNLTVNHDLLSLLACWSEIGTHGNTALYQSMFLTPTLLKQNPVFADSGYGAFLQHVEVPYTHSQPTLELPIVTAASGKIDYNASTKQVSYRGVLDAATRDALKAVPGVHPDFQRAVDDLYRMQRLATHAEALRSACNLSGDEFSLIVEALGFVPKSTSVTYTHAQSTLEQAILDAAQGWISYSHSDNQLSYRGFLTTDIRDALKAVPGVTVQFQQAVDALYAANQNALAPLTLENVSAIYRRGWLARKLKLSVCEFLLLMELTGLDPFAKPDPTDPAILRLIELVQSMKDRSLKSATALYLIWNRDLSGKSSPDAAQIAEIVRALRGDFASINDQFAAIEDPNGDVARARVALVYGQQTSDAFFALLDDTLVVDVAYTHSADTLEVAITTADPRIAYDSFRHRLSHRGSDFKNINGVSVDFQKAVDALVARSEEIKGLFFTAHHELSAPYTIAVAAPLADRHRAFLATFDPELSRRRKRQQALQRLGAAAGVDLILTQTLMDSATGPSPLHAAGGQSKPALDDVLALETPGLRAQFFFRDTATGNIDQSVPAAVNLDYASGGSNPLPNPGQAISGIWSGHIETPEAGFYNFVIEVDSLATVTLQLGGNSCPLTTNGKVRRNIDRIELKAGELYEIELTVANIKDRLSLKWETPERAREVIPSRYLYPPTILDPFSNAYTRFLKSASLATGLGLTANELAYFATHTDYQIGGDGWLNALPVSGNPTPGTASALLKPFKALLDFSRIKAEISPNDESLLAVFKDPAKATQNTDSLLFTITRWNQTSLSDVLTQFSGNIAGLGHFDLLRRVNDAFALVQKMGISTNALIQATTNEPTGETVHDLQAALRARYDAASWRDVVKPINDEMRSLQRDALVAYILHQMRSHPQSAHIDTPNKLFEYFLMDVQMDPCMQTSRIRHALSSVQLFIERCLMNLEPRVSSAAINAAQWAWMKRYRVWEANRKVFLFPENWLEPELRDDKSPFFKEIESELLQSDITEDSATTALLNYLAKLEEVAKLEPCGIHHVEAGPRTPAIDHVVARTAGASRKYYYRRREGVSWTPWEQIKLDIEDNPVIPVVWNDRLLLFWLRILKQPPLNVPPIPKDLDTKMSDLPASTVFVGYESKVTVQAVLCWSEYYNGKWQSTKTSDVNRPTSLGPTSLGPDVFDRSIFQLLPVEDKTQKVLRIWIWGGLELSSFLLYNTHSLPLRGEEDATINGPQRSDSLRHLRRIGKVYSSGPLVLQYVASADVVYDTVHVYGTGHLDSIQIISRSANLADRIVTVLTSTDGTTYQHSVVAPNPGNLGDSWDAPFFYEDSRHVFYVSTAEGIVPISQQNDIGIVVKTPDWGIVGIPPLVFEPAENIRDSHSPIIKQPGSGVTDPLPFERDVTEDAYIHRRIGSSEIVRFDGNEIGPAGSGMNSKRMK